MAAARVVCSSRRLPTGGPKVARPRRPPARRHAARRPNHPGRPAPSSGDGEGTKATEKSPPGPRRTTGSEARAMRSGESVRFMGDPLGSCAASQHRALWSEPMAGAPRQPAINFIRGVRIPSSSPRMHRPSCADVRYTIPDHRPHGKENLREKFGVWLLGDRGLLGPCDPRSGAFEGSQEFEGREFDPDRFGREPGPISQFIDGRGGVEGLDDVPLGV